MVVGLTIVAIIAALIIQFRNIIGPLILAFILAYLLHPVAGLLTRTTNLAWRASVNLIYLLLVVLLGGLFFLTGLAAVQQLQSLVEVVETFVINLPELLDTLTNQVYFIGPFQLDFRQFDLQPITDQLLGYIQVLVGQAGQLISAFATSAAATLGWALFILLISYFLLADAGQVEVMRVDVPGYNADIQRLAFELRGVWNAFLRGQLIIITLVIIAYMLLMMILGVRYAGGLSILAGMSRFIPYIGPLITWIVMTLVSLFQGSNHFGLEPVQFAILVVVSGIILDQIFDNLVTPRFLGSTLGVHPAAVLVAAIIATNLIGLVGLVLAAPVLATIKLVGRYVLRKMFDMDPWPEPPPPPERFELPWIRFLEQLRIWWNRLQHRVER